MMTTRVRLVIAVLWILGFGGGGTTAASAAELFTASKSGSYEDAKFDLTNAVIERGLVIDYAGNVSGMLDRTGADVGSDRKLYRQAEYFVFCSAKLSRQMMEADPANLGFCPFVVFIYERADKPGEVIVGARLPEARGSDASKAALAEVGALLKDIVGDAAK